jgi:predicted nucleic acid-binding protein
MSEIEEQAQLQRDEAKRLLTALIYKGGLPDKLSSLSVDRIVDCIISAAILEVTALYANALRDVRGK